MAQINFRIDDALKAEAESLFNSLGMNTTTALMIFIRQSLSEHAIPFAIRQVASSQTYAEELTSRIRDMEAGRNCHVHELIDADADASDHVPQHAALNSRKVSRRVHRAKVLA